MTKYKIEYMDGSFIEVDGWINKDKFLLISKNDDNKRTFYPLFSIKKIIELEDTKKEIGTA